MLTRSKLHLLQVTFDAMALSQCLMKDLWGRPVQLFQGLGRADGVLLHQKMPPLPHCLLVPMWRRAVQPFLTQKPIDLGDPLSSGVSSHVPSEKSCTPQCLPHITVLTTPAIWGMVSLPLIYAVSDIGIEK